jgi:hypothetical protein
LCIGHLYSPKEKCTIHTMKFVISVQQ